jgi:acetyl-CoA/propionyl-CoA carboxylase biotin carboxyl carrier protein
VRVDAGYVAGDTVPAFYDDLLGKLVAWAPDRDQAIARMRAALDDLAVEGVASTAPALARILDAGDFRAATHWTTWLEEALDLGGLAPAATPDPEPDFQVSVGTRTWPVRLYRHRPHGAAGAAEGGGLVASPLAGTLVKVEVAPGQRVAGGQLLAVVEAMKMETPLLAPFSGTVVGVRCAVGGPVAAGQIVVELETEGVS